MPRVNAVTDYNRFLLKDLQISYKSSKSILYPQISEDLKELNELFTKYFTSLLLRISCDLLAYKKYIKNIELPFTKEIDSFYNHKENRKAPHVNIFYYAYKLMQTGEETYFHSLRKSIRRYEKYFEQNDIANMYILLSGYAMGKVEEGNRSFLKQAFQIYNEVLRKKLYEIYEGNNIHHMAFKNILSCALQYRKLKWAEDFINTYGKKLTSAHQTNMANYGKSYLSFYKQDYSVALGSLSKIKASDILYKILIKNLTLKILYEMNNRKLLEYTMDSYRHFLKNNREKVEALTYSKEDLFLKCIPRLLKLRSEFDPVIYKEVSGLAKRLSGENRQWVSKQVKLINK